MGVEKAANGVSERHAGEEGVHIHAQPPANRAARSGSFDCGLFEALKQSMRAG